MIDNAPTVKEIPTKIPINVFEQLISQEPILNKIRAEIDRQEKWLLQAGYTAYNTDIAFDAIKAVLVEMR